jgi:hypothetical protein
MHQYGSSFSQPRKRPDFAFLVLVVLNSAVLIAVGSYQFLLLTHCTWQSDESGAHVGADILHHLLAIFASVDVQSLVAFALPPLSTNHLGEFFGVLVVWEALTYQASSSPLVDVAQIGLEVGTDRVFVPGRDMLACADSCFGLVQIEATGSLADPHQSSTELVLHAPQVCHQIPGPPSL